MKPRETEHGLLALAFARALVNQDFSTAHSMLSQNLKKELSQNEIQTKFNSMIEYGEGLPDFIDIMNVLDDWPTKQSNDIGWAYCAISGDGYSEAVALVVTNENGRQVVREIEWGRP